jgi:hypothetical protein
MKPHPLVRRDRFGGSAEVGVAFVQYRGAGEERCRGAAGACVGIHLQCLVTACPERLQLLHFLEPGLAETCLRQRVCRLVHVAGGERQQGCAQRGGFENVLTRGHRVILLLDNGIGLWVID